MQEWETIICLCWFEIERTMLVYKSIHAWATWTTIEPEYDRIFRRIHLWFNKVIPQIFPMLLINCDVPLTSKPKNNIEPQKCKKIERFLNYKIDNKRELSFGHCTRFKWRYSSFLPIYSSKERKQRTQFLPGVVFWRKSATEARKFGDKSRFRSWFCCY